jgi:hypothetical protein
MCTGTFTFHPENESGLSERKKKFEFLARYEPKFHTRTTGRYSSHASASGILFGCMGENMPDLRDDERACCQFGCAS